MRRDAPEPGLPVRVIPAQEFSGHQHAIWPVRGHIVDYACHPTVETDGSQQQGGPHHGPALRSQHRRRMRRMGV